MLRGTRYAGPLPRRDERRFKGAAQAVTSLFTGPRVPKISAPPGIDEEEEARKRRRQEEQAAAKRRGLGQTVLAGGQGLGEPQTRAATLLGGSGQGVG